MTLGFGSAVIGTGLGTLYAWLIYRTDTPFKKIFDLIVLLGLTVPLLFKVFGWIALLSPNIGIINRLLIAAGLGPIFNVFSEPGMILVNGLDVVPVAYLILAAAMRSIDPSLEEASRVSGNSSFKTLFKVTTPLVLPAFLSTFVLLFIETMNFFEAPLILGAGYFHTFVTQIYYFANEATPPNYVAATYYGLFNIGLTFAIFALYIYLTRSTSRYQVVVGKVSRSTLNRLGRWKIVGFLFCFVILLLVFILPVGALAYYSFIGFSGVFHPVFSLSNYVAAIHLPYLRSAIVNTIEFATAAALGSTVIALIMSYASLKAQVRGSRLVELLSNVPLAIPGVVYGFALFIMFLFLPGLSLMYGTIFPIIIAISFLYLPTSMRITSSSLIQISNELEDAARVSGASWGRTFRLVTVRLMMRSLFNSYIRGFLDSIRELGPIVLLSTSGSLVIVTLFFSLFNAGGTSLSVLAAGSIIVTAIAAGFLIAYRVIERFVIK